MTERTQRAMQAALRPLFSLRVLCVKSLFSPVWSACTGRW
ncbi:MAG: hypothetical protein AVDCRST_MAG89-4909 [uncultured Gemmatimonadetes bacterium]|uniref:Uncharacterized protein n=1 Tax=uncultured Gemmatimonadota bacterium TaxID=203437 RepID=A0A6J4N4P6_9BACT|nr:MAG: hypothetical protein AVDCRST_MAG89-4909 [uncultured Gemmatimonadota bacterium]